MKIAHVLHPFIPGMGYQENYLPAKQQALGHDVTVLTSARLPEKFHAHAGTDRYQLGTTMDNGVPVRRLPTRVEVKAIEDVVLKGLWSALDELDPDVVHLHNLVSPRTLQTLAWTARSDARLFVDVHIDNDNFHLDTTGKRLAFEAFRRGVLPLLLRRADGFLPVNPQSERFLRETLRLPDEHVSLLPLGVDTDRFAPDAAAGAAVRTSLGIAPAQQVVLFVGNIEPTKDLELLLEAFSRLGEQVTNDERAPVLLVLGGGDTEYLQSLHDRAARLGVVDRVQFVGSVPHEELPAYYNAADVGVWPGKLGVSIIEAIGTGLPIIVCDSDATSFLTAYDNGLVFPRKDRTALVDRLTSYLSDEELRTAHGARAVEYATDRLSWTKVAERSIELYCTSDGRFVETETETTGRREATESTTYGTVRS